MYTFFELHYSKLPRAEGDDTLIRQFDSDKSF